jgi:hypothetical protein
VTSPEPAASPPGSTRTGPGRLLVAVYALFALSAFARAVVQITTKFSHAPVAYVLSAFAAVVYILATITLAVGSPTARRIAVLSCSVELAGVLAVGTWSLVDRATFPDATVWSGYGSGYGFVPLVLPVFGLLWLRRWTVRTGTRRTIVASARDAGDATGGGNGSSDDLHGLRAAVGRKAAGKREPRIRSEEKLRAAREWGRAFAPAWRLWSPGSCGPKNGRPTFLWARQEDRPCGVP